MLITTKNSEREKERALKGSLFPYSSPRLSSGFTIVELLIVIVVIGILAAIVIVAFNGIQRSAAEASVKSDLAGMAKKLEEYKVRSANGLYPANATELAAADIKLGKGNYLTTRNNVYYCRSTDGQYYAVGMYSKFNAKYYMRNGTVQEQAATVDVNGGNTCSYIGQPAPTSAYSGYDHSNETGWQPWVK